jgi:ketosteroid isomerase-like protein
MSAQNVETVRALIPTADTDFVALFRDDRLWSATAEALGPVFDAGFECEAVWQEGTTFRGVGGLRKLWLDWLEPWATYHAEVDEIIDAGHRVVALVRNRGRRHDMDAEVEIITGSVWEFRDGRVARAEFCRDRKEALGVAGLSEQDVHAE